VDDPSEIGSLEYYLAHEGGTSWKDNREVVMLGGIKADLLRFDPTDPSEFDELLKTVRS
jgi:hypothetical protein